MPSIINDFHILNSRLIYDANKSFINTRDVYFSLRKVIGTDYSPEGLYSTYDIITFPTHTASAITELYGFDEKVEYDVDEDTGDNLGTVEYQISNDGSTWYGWNGSIWSSISPLWNSANVIDQHIQSFTFNGDYKEIRIRAKISSDSSQKYTPKLYGCYVYLEYKFNWMEDAKRSLKHFIEDNILIRDRVRVTLAASLNYVDLDSKLTVVNIVGAYNLTDDIGRLNNLYASIAGNRVFLSTTQDTGDIIEVVLNGTAKVYLSVDPEFKTAELPAYILKFGSASDSRLESSGAREIDRKRSTLVCRERRIVSYLDVPIEILAIDDTHVGSLAMNQAVQDLLETEGINFRSEACGERFDITRLVPYESRDDTTQRVFLKVCSFVMSGKYWFGTYRDKKLVETVRLGYTSNGVLLESQEVTDE